MAVVGGKEVAGREEHELLALGYARGEFPRAVVDATESGCADRRR
jgi:hypothetical protein